MLDPRASTVADVLRRSAAREPARTALRFTDDTGTGRTWTYAELDAAVTRAAGVLLRVGARKGDRVAAFGRNSDAYVIGFLACARAGLVHVPINHSFTGAELVYPLWQSGSTFALVDPVLAEPFDAVVGETAIHTVLRLRDAPGSLLCCALDSAGEDSSPAELTNVDVASDDLVQLLYTSGTTSAPKGAMMTHRALLHEYVSCVVGLDLRSDDRPLHVMPLYHSAQLHVFLLPHLLIGSVNELVESPAPSDVLRRIEADGVRSFFAAPTLWVALSQHDEFATRELGSLVKAYYGASIMPGPVLRRLRETLPHLGFYNCFGQSEIGPLAAVLRPEEHDARPDSAGRAALFVETRVVDEHGTDVDVGELGEVVYRSPQLCTGYWDAPAETATAFRDGWFRSGDLVRTDEHGYLYVVDRIKDVINTGGVLVASREVEDVFHAHSAVAEVAVIGVDDDRWVEAITAVVVTKSEVDESELLAHAHERLAAFKVPKRVHFTTELPRNSAGKLLKRVLREQHANETD